MPIKDCQTEQQIIQTAMVIFFKEGRFNATLQEIADAAGVSRPLIHYHFRSKDVLIKKVNETANRIYKENLDSILCSDLPFRKKIENFITETFRKFEEFPYLELYFTMEIIQETMNNYKTQELTEEEISPIRTFLEEIKKEMEKGTIITTNPVNYFISLFSLTMYPFLVQPLQLKLLGLDKEGYLKYLSGQKQYFLDMLIPNKNQESN